MGVDEAGADEAAARIEIFGLGADPRFGQLGFGAEPGDAAAGDRDGSFGDRGEGGDRVGTQRPIAGDDFRGVANDEVEVIHQAVRPGTLTPRSFAVAIASS